MKNFPGNIIVAKYSIGIEAQDTLLLPEYKGSTLRGGFGTAFKKISCVQKKRKCDECLLKEKCVYSVIFESSQSINSVKLKSFDEIPRPFVIEPPLDKKTKYNPGEELTFGLILFGKSIEYLPYIIYTFIELGNIGIGRDRGRFILKHVKDHNGTVIYDGETEVMKNVDSSFCQYEPLHKTSKSVSSLKLSFLTPTRIKYDGQYINVPEFHIIIRTLLRRISSLSYFYCGSALDIDFKETIKSSQKIKLVNSRIRWFDWERYSARQKTKMKLGGFLGEATYEGDLTEFLPYLELGVYTHIGKNTTFGLGRYEIKL